ncbi:MAG: NCS2 family permease [Acidobacteria bacterium]|nr:NCS2 family permease [Acidobacteriota bacterium]NIM60401.1 NCS2 family permease [Acidobacteriota bacterium]NIO58576.1 NCS2 family permease [Acidobacteriota bacterium]NIQ29628.1 NCS2 family permease [Acidobacteriota bacterium]NIQ84345.1 NCS2 family permease [Acidobacteriota bacterium]
MLERLFRLRENATTVRTELLGGLTTFMTMAYIVFVNPAVLSQTGMDFDAVLVATCLSAGLATWVMGLAANYPIAMAPGMGENFFFVTVVVGMGLSWQVALAAVFVSGVVFFLLTFMRIREMIIDAVPASLKLAIGGGVGLFICLIGLVTAGIVEPADGGGLLRLGDLGRTPVLVALFGLVLIAVLMARGTRGAIMVGILGSTALAWALGLVEWQGLVASPPSVAPTFLQLDLAGLLDAAVIPVVIIFLFMAVFDAIGTLIGIGEQGGFLKDGKLPRATPALMADSSGTVVGSLLGTSTVTAFVESASGVAAGARTGLANVMTGSLFLLALFFSPIVRMVGGGVPVEGGPPLQPMTAPALIIVGVLMARVVRRIEWEDFTEAFPAFLVMVGIPFAWSIADGIAFGFISYPLLKLLSGRGREASWLVYVLGLIFALRYALL